MADTGTATRWHRGLAHHPVDWSVLEEIFDAMFGEDVRDLKRWPATMHNVFAQWTDARGVTHEADTLDDVKDAYVARETYSVSFSGRREGGRDCHFEYWPGGEPRARAVVQGAPEAVDAMIAPVRAAFPLQRRVVFVSWSGARAKRVAEAIRTVIDARLPPGGEVFFSPLIRPGADPLREMLDRNLLLADTHIVVVTSESAASHWVVWETAASWARRIPVIPVFVDMAPSLVEGPLPLLAQGVKFDDDMDLQRGIREALLTVGADASDPLLRDELETLKGAAKT